MSSGEFSTLEVAAADDVVNIIFDDTRVGRVSRQELQQFRYWQELQTCAAADENSVADELDMTSIAHYQSDVEMWIRHLQQPLTTWTSDAEALRLQVIYDYLMYQGDGGGELYPRTL
jgi:hypothetical protein